MPYDLIFSSITVVMLVIFALLVSFLVIGRK